MLFVMDFLLILCCKMLFLCIYIDKSACWQNLVPKVTFRERCSFSGGCASCLYMKVGLSRLNFCLYLFNCTLTSFSLLCSMQYFVVIVNFRNKFSHWLICICGCVDEFFGFFNASLLSTENFQWKAFGSPSS